MVPQMVTNYNDYESEAYLISTKYMFSKPLQLTQLAARPVSWSQSLSGSWLQDVGCYICPYMRDRVTTYV